MKERFQAQARKRRRGSRIEAGHFTPAMRGRNHPARSLLVLLALAVTGCETPQTKSIERFIEREILVVKPETVIGDKDAREAAERRCGGPVALLPDRDGQTPEDFICIPPPA